MEGHLIYRYSLDQIEIEGNWSMSSEYSKNRFSYLLHPKENVIQIPINKNDIDFSHSDSNSIYVNKYMTKNGENFLLNICSANIFEILLIPNKELFNNILKFLSGEFHGFFMYYGKTIEDRFNLHFSLEDNHVNVNGEGTNNLGVFNFIGFVNFFTIKDELINNNNLDSEIINFGMIKLTRIYNDFNSNENNRVIKSFQHSRKKFEDYND